MNYPEHEKLKSLEGKNQIVGDFIEWLRSEKRIQLAKYYHFKCFCCQTYLTESISCPVCEREECESCDATDVREISDGALLVEHVSTETLLSEYFGIDRKKLEKEKRAMLDEIRSKV